MSWTRCVVPAVPCELAVLLTATPPDQAVPTGCLLRLQLLILLILPP